MELDDNGDDDYIENLNVEHISIQQNQNSIKYIHDED